MKKHIVFVTVANVCGLLPFLKLVSATCDIVTNDASLKKHIASGGIPCRFSSKPLVPDRSRGFLVSILPECFSPANGHALDKANLERMTLALHCARLSDRFAVISRVDDYASMRADFEARKKREPRLGAPVTNHPVSDRLRSELAERSIMTAMSWLSQCRTHMTRANGNGVHGSAHLA